MPATRPDAARPSVLLMLVREGDRLVCFLSDGRGIGLQAHTPWAPFDPIQAQADRLTGPDDPARRLAFGRRLHDELLPLAVRQTLARLGPCDLTLQLAPDLAGLPWELAHDGEAHLDERHAVARRVIDGHASPAQAPSPPSTEPLRVLVLADGGVDGGADAPAEPAADLLAMLHGHGLRALRVEPTAIEPAALDALLHHHDVVHLVDAAHGLDDETSHGGLALMVVQGAQDARADLGAWPPALARQVERAVRAGVPVLLQAQGPVFLEALYACLGAGIALGESVRRARVAGRARGEPCLHVTLLGDPSRRLAVAGRVATTQADHVRQVTVLSCDLVDSTRLMHQLGDEAYSELLASYHASIAASVAEHGGRADDPQGDDGVMCYFGFPLAIENAAVMALRAGLQILSRCAALGLPVRLGAATGQVVVKADQPVGAAVHYAARLQGLAPPGALIASEATRRVVGERFEFEPLGLAPAMKGFDQPGEIHRVRGESGLRGTERFDRQPQLAPFVGRADELDWLRQRSRLDGTAPPQARALRVLGEAGIGKSRLVREFRRSEAGRGWRFIEWRCAPEHASTAWHPVTEFLGRFLGWRDGDSDAWRRASIAAIGRDRLPQEHGHALLAQLLGLPGEPGEPGERGELGDQAVLAGWSSERQRRATMDLLLQWMWQAVDAGPVCLLVEDLHWIDPSTRELITRALAEGAGRRLLLLLTARPEPGEDDGLGADTLLLSGLTPDHARRMVDGLCGARRIDPDRAQWLLERADGVPLFLEESTRMLLDLAKAPAVPVAPTAPAALAQIPATIHDLLMARLDRQPPAKRLAQVASVIGREFTRSLLGAVATHPGCPVDVADLDDDMATLVQADLLIPRGTAREPVYLFRHALLRDAAYGSLWERDRRRLHGVIAEVIERNLPHVAEGQPELLARHLTDAARYPEAVTQWERAARRSAARSAHREAIADLEQARVLLDHLPAGLDRDQRALRLNLLLASRLIATEGYGADRVEHVYGQALALARRLGDDVALGKALFGLEGFHFMRADFERARQIGQEADVLAQRSSDPMARLQSLWSEANLVFHQGDLPGAVQRMDRCLADYRSLPHRPAAVQDPGVMCLCYSAWALWQMGQPDEALRRAREVVDLSGRLQHRFSMAEAWGFLSVIHYFRGEDAAALEAVQQAIDISQDGGFSVWLAHAEVVRGRLLVQVGEVDRGVALLRAGYRRWVDSGAVVTRTFYLSLWAQGEAAAGRSDQALALLAEARELVATHGERYHEPELLRLSGEFQRLMALGERRPGRAVDPGHLRARFDEAAAWLDQARERAAATGQHGVGLRVAISRYRLQRDLVALGLVEGAGAGPAARDLAAALAAVQGSRSSRDERWAVALLARGTDPPPGTRVPLWIDATLPRSFDLPGAEPGPWTPIVLSAQDSG